MGNLSIMDIKVLQSRFARLASFLSDCAKQNKHCHFFIFFNLFNQKMIFMQNLLEKDNNVQISNVNQLNVNHEQHKNLTGY